jgi:hypothetical protein
VLPALKRAGVFSCLLVGALNASRMVARGFEMRNHPSPNRCWPVHTAIRGGSNLL